MSKIWTIPHRIFSSFTDKNICPQWNDNPIVYLDKRLFLSSPRLYPVQSFKCFMHEQDLCIIHIYKINFCSDYSVQLVWSKKEMEQNGTHFLFWSGSIVFRLQHSSKPASHLKMFALLRKRFICCCILLTTKFTFSVINWSERLTVQRASEWIQTVRSFERWLCDTPCVPGCM